MRVNACMSYDIVLCLLATERVMVIRQLHGGMQALRWFMSPFCRSGDWSSGVKHVVRAEYNEISWLRECAYSWW